MVTHSPRSSKTLRRMSPGDARLPRMAERSMVPHRQRARTPILPRDEPLLSLTPDVPSTQTPLEHTDSDCGRCSSNSSSTPNAGYPTPGEAGTLQSPDRNPPYPQLQRLDPRDTRAQTFDTVDSIVRSNPPNEPQPLGNNQVFTQRKPTYTAHIKLNPNPRIALVGSSGNSSRWLPITWRF